MKLHSEAVTDEGNGVSEVDDDNNNNNNDDVVVT